MNLPCFPAFLIPVIVAFQVFYRVDSGLVDKVVNICRYKENKFATTEDKYVRKRPVAITEPQFYVRPFFVQQPNAYDLQLSQRIFQCIADALNEDSDDELQSSHRYRSLVQECKTKQIPTPYCDVSYQYRSIDGSCNNLFFPKLGSTFECLHRLWPANYEGVSDFRKSVERNQPLPNPRAISRKLIKSDIKLAKDYNALFAFFGQLVAHDLSLMPISTVRGNKTLDCCEHISDRHQHPECATILLDSNDEFYISKNISCLSVIRMEPCGTCSVEKRVPLNEETAWIDCSHVYGQTDIRAEIQRRYDGSGKLKSKFTEAGEFPTPFKEDGSRFGDATKEQYCFDAGDSRVNQHLPLSILYTLQLREHNRIADKLKVLNPQWDKEKLYQEARRIVIAEFQIILYNEFLPILLGQKLMSKHGLNIGSRGTYDPFIDASILLEFNTAAFRLHSIVPRKVVFSEDFELLKFLYRNLVPIYNDKMSIYLDKMADTAAEKYDRFMPVDITQFLYRRSENGTYGFDLVVANINRGRDVGLPTYSQVIQYMENKPRTIKTFDDLRDYIVPDCQSILENIYANVGDIDLFVALLCEKIPDDMIISPTAAHIIAEQFRRLKYGDRFYIEHDRTLTTAQQETLLNASMARLICDNTKVNVIQRMALLLPSAKNIPQFCSTIPGVNLEKWKEKLM